MMKRFIKINESFACSVCGEENPPVEATCRDHCRKCLCSVHVDVNPGDRAADCGGILQPVGVVMQGAELRAVQYKCEKCGYEHQNKIALDDDRERLFEVIEKSQFLC